jgi:hypothetical protein
MCEYCGKDTNLNEKGEILTQMLATFLWRAFEFVCEVV